MGVSRTVARLLGRLPEAGVLRIEQPGDNASRNATIYAYRPSSGFTITEGAIFENWQNRGPANLADRYCDIPKTQKRNPGGIPHMAEAVMYQREDWTDFRNLATLTRRAGVPAKKLMRVVLKELTDNGLDYAGTCRCGELGDGTFYVQDDGGGIPGTPEEIATLFSVGRPLTSSKLVRLPSRGALGNGLRVVVGAVLATGGTLVVRTRGQSIYLEPQAKEGTTAVKAVETWDGAGTRIEVGLGPCLEETDPTPMVWAKLAIKLAGKGTGYKGKTSAFWFDSDSFWELGQAAGGRTVRDFIAQFDGCAEPKAGPIAEAYLNRTADSLSRDEAENLLLRARRNCKMVKPYRLGEIGPLSGYPGHMKRPGEFEISAALGSVGGTIPVMVEAWAKKADVPQITLCVNRTPTTAEVWLRRHAEKKTNYQIFGCDLGYEVAVGQKHDFHFLVNVQAPYLPLLTDGKTPSLDALAIPLVEAMEGAARRAAKLLRKSSSDEEVNQKSLARIMHTLSWKMVSNKRKCMGPQG
jgi:hypothetical protein